MDRCWHIDLYLNCRSWAGSLAEVVQGELLDKNRIFYNLATKEKGDEATDKYDHIGRGGY